MLKKEKKFDPSENASDDLIRAIKLQRTNPEFISFYIFLGTTVQLDDVAMMWNNSDDVLYIDTTFNLCSYWLTDCCYKKFRLKNTNGDNPNFIGPSPIHFEKNELIFSRLNAEMCTFQPQIKDLKYIGTDLENAIFNGFSSQINELKRLLCVRHLQINDKKKLSDLNTSKNGAATILGDIYGWNYGSVKEYGIADSKDADDLHERLNSVKENWENYCPGFYDWFCKKRLRLFKESVIESVRRNTSITGLFYNNGNNCIESKHFCEKNEQNFQRSDIWQVISTMKSLI